MKLDGGAMLIQGHKCSSEIGALTAAAPGFFFIAAAELQHKTKVSWSIKLAASVASGPPEHLYETL